MEDDPCSALRFPTPLYIRCSISRFVPPPPTPFYIHIHICIYIYIHIDIYIHIPSLSSVSVCSSCRLSHFLRQLSACVSLTASLASNALTLVCRLSTHARSSTDWLMAYQSLHGHQCMHACSFINVASLACKYDTATATGKI